MMFRYCSLLLLLCAPLHAGTLIETLTGTIRVVDGDTIELSSPHDIRLVGIDAPEVDQLCRDASGATLACGEIATERARQAYDGRPGRCDVEGHDRYGRPLAVCHVGDREMNADLVRRGIARIYRAGMRYEDPRYLEEQAEAIRLAHGFWTGEMQDPAAWRAERRGGAARKVSVGGCDIKGNISDNGRLYHLPGSRAYTPTRIDARRGERWFCSENEARQAGWSKSES